MKKFEVTVVVHIEQYATTIVCAEDEDAAEAAVGKMIEDGDFLLPDVGKGNRVCLKAKLKRGIIWGEHDQDAEIDSVDPAN